MTSLLLDTHAMLWFFWDDPRLSATAKSLMDFAGEIRRVLKRGGTAVLTGFVEPKDQQVASHYNEHGFEVAETPHKGEWVCLIARRR